MVRMDTTHDLESAPLVCTYINPYIQYVHTRNYIAYIHTFVLPVQSPLSSQTRDTRTIPYQPLEALYLLTVRQHGDACSLIVIMSDKLRLRLSPSINHHEAITTKSEIRSIHGY